MATLKSIINKENCEGSMGTLNYMTGRTFLEQLGDVEGLGGTLVYEVIKNLFRLCFIRSRNFVFRSKRKGRGTFNISVSKKPRELFGHEME